MTGYSWPLSGGPVKEEARCQNCRATIWRFPGTYWRHTNGKTECTVKTRAEPVR